MYSYSDLLEDVRFLGRRGATVGSIGKSAFGRDIPFVALGQGPAVLVTAGMHAREWVSTLFAVKQLYRCLSQPLACTVVCVPLTNPDGSVLVECGAAPFGERAAALRALCGGDDFSLWKASATGVDLNVNFDADWGTGAQNARTPAPANYVGPFAGSEPETAALCAFTEKTAPALTISYHAKGREIYFAFGQTGERLLRDRAVADEAARITGYTLVEGTRGSAGGYKDWCIRHLGIPALTVELCSDSLPHPLDESAIEEDFAVGKDLPVQLMAFLRGK